MIVHRYGRVGYDFAVRQVGVTLVEIGDENGTTPDELENAISEKTAAIFYFANPNREHLWVPYQKAIAIAHRHGVPFIVDAACTAATARKFVAFYTDGGGLSTLQWRKRVVWPTKQWINRWKEIAD